MTRLLTIVALLGYATNLAALKIGITLQDVDRALTIARSSPPERERFHAPYLRTINTPFVERVEVVSELRRVVQLAEDQIARGDRLFAYSTTRANDALTVFRRRVSVIARVRFHPQNNYVEPPPVTVALVGNDAALIGIRREAIFALPPGRKGEFVPILGSVIEGSFEAEAIGQATREFTISLDGRELGRFTFDFAAVE